MTNERLIQLILGGLGILLYYYYHLQKKKGDGGGSDSVKNGSVLFTYTRDLTKDAQAEKLDPVIGRDEEVNRLIHILARRTKNNPLLLGEPGVGKTAIVEGIALRIAHGQVPRVLANKRVLSLDLGGLISGTKYRGEFEQRMKRLTDEIREMGRQVILFIDEVHMIEQARGAEGAMNISDILKPALSRGDLQAIGATTWKEYEQYIKTDDALNRRFQPIIVGEPSPDAALEILRGIKSAYETHHGVLYDESTLRAAVTLSKKIKDRFLPDKAIDLIDEAGAKVSIESSHLAQHAMGLLHAAGKRVPAQLKELRQKQRALKLELKHIQSLEHEIPDPELKEVEQKIEHLLAQLTSLDQQIKLRTLNRTPRVQVADIQDVVHEWVGKRIPFHKRTLHSFS